jgi:hypothetical protein
MAKINSFSAGEFVGKCLQNSAKFVCKKETLFSIVSLCGATMMRQVEGVSSDLHK